MCLAAIRNCVAPKSLSFIPLTFSTIAKTIAATTSFLPGSSCPPALHELSTSSLVVSIASQCFERLILPTQFQGKTTLLIGGSILVCYGICEYVSGVNITNNILHKSYVSEEERLTVICQLSSAIFNGMSLFFSGAAKIIIGSQMVHKSVTYIPDAHTNRQLT